jgi:hypothetical protein
MEEAAKFDVEVVFSGLCAFVPDDDLPKAKKLCVILVNGASGTTTELNLDPPPIPLKALDGKILRRHFGLVRVPFSNLAKGNEPPETAEALWYLKPGTRLSFRTDPPEASQGGVKIDLSDPKGKNKTSFKWVADMNGIIGQGAAVALGALSPTPPENILAQVLLKGGEVQTTFLPLEIWKFMPKLKSTKKNYQTQLAHRVSVFFRSVTKASLIATDTNTGKRKPLELKPDGSGRVKVHISNMCDQNPLEWSAAGPIPKDEDVRWYYELLSDEVRSFVKGKLAKTGLPIPWPHASGGGPDCSPHTLAKANFDLLDAADSKED